MLDPNVMRDLRKALHERARACRVQPMRAMKEEARASIVTCRAQQNVTLHFCHPHPSVSGTPSLLHSPSPSVVFHRPHPRDLLERGGKGVQGRGGGGEGGRGPPTLPEHTQSTGNRKIIGE